MAKKAKVRRIYLRAKHSASRHPKAVTRGINAIGLLIGFGQEASGVVTDIMQGKFDMIPKDIAYYGIGLNYDGTLDTNQLIRSASAKLAGFGWAWGAKQLAKRLKVM